MISEKYFGIITKNLKASAMYMKNPNFTFKQNNDLEHTSKIAKF